MIDVYEHQFGHMNLVMHTLVTLYIHNSHDLQPSSNMSLPDLSPLNKTSQLRPFLLPLLPIPIPEQTP